MYQRLADVLVPEITTFLEQADTVPYRRFFVAGERVNPDEFILQNTFVDIDTSFPPEDAAAQRSVHAQATLREESRVRLLFANLLSRLSLVPFGLKAVRAGLEPQLYHRDFAHSLVKKGKNRVSNVPANCCTLIWAWDGPRRIEVVPIDHRYVLTPQPVHNSLQSQSTMDPQPIHN